MELDCRSSTGLGETETPLLEGTYKFSCAPGPRAKAVTSQHLGPDLPAGLGGSSGEGGGTGVWLWLSLGHKSWHKYQMNNCVQVKYSPEQPLKAKSSSVKLCH